MPEMFLNETFKLQTCLHLCPEEAIKSNKKLSILTKLHNHGARPSKIYTPTFLSYTSNPHAFCTTNCTCIVYLQNVIPVVSLSVEQCTSTYFVNQDPFLKLKKNHTHQHPTPCPPFQLHVNKEESYSAQFSR